jgi:hypothetical protein
MTTPANGWARSTWSIRMASGSGAVVRLGRTAVMSLVDEQDRVQLMWRHRYGIVQSSPAEHAAR